MRQGGRAVVSRCQSLAVEYRSLLDPYPLQTYLPGPGIHSISRRHFERRLSSTATAPAQNVVSKVKSRRSRRKRSPDAPAKDAASLGSPWRGLREARNPATTVQDGEKLQNATTSSSVKSPRRGAWVLSRNSALDTALSAHVHVAGLPEALKFIYAVQPYVPGPCAAAALVDAVASAASSAIRADAALDAMLRLRTIFHVKTSAPLLAAVARAAKHDPVAEMRSQRALSVVRAMRRDRVAPTCELLRACFEACVAGIDVKAALSVMDFARSAGLLERQAGDNGTLSTGGGASTFPEFSSGLSEPPLLGPFEIEFYNGVIQAAIFSGNYGAATAAFREMSLRGLDGHRTTLSLLIVLYAELGKHELAYNVVSVLRERDEFPTSVAYAALIRLAGSRGDSSSALMLFQEFESRLTRGADMQASLSTITTGSFSAHQKPSTATLAASKLDVVFSMFQALRSARDADRAINFLRYMQREYKFKASSTVISLLFETFCRAVPQRLDLAQEVRGQVSKAPLSTSKLVTSKKH